MYSEPYGVGGEGGEGLLILYSNTYAWHVLGETRADGQLECAFRFLAR